jgi:hypothetical protein
MESNPSSDKDRKKTMAAVMVAVNAFIEEEEKAHELIAPSQRSPALAVNMWHVSGREEIMRMRQLWQRRIV